VGEISQNHQLQTLSWSLPQHFAHHRRSNTLKIRTDGIQRRMAKPLVWPNHLWFPSAPSSSSSNDGLYNTTLNSLTLEFKQIACSSLNLNSINHANSPCALHALLWINLHTLYSSHSFKFLWTYILIGTPCYLNNWLMWYDWMNGTMLFFAKYLGFLLKKIINSLSPQINKILPKPKLDIHAQTFICSLTLLW